MRVKLVGLQSLVISSDTTWRCWEGICRCDNVHNQLPERVGLPSVTLAADSLSKGPVCRGSA